MEVTGDAVDDPTPATSGELAAAALAARQPVGEEGEHIGELGRIAEVEAYLGQMFHARPAAGYADLCTPVCGVYQAGSATHGGGVTWHPRP
jgi:hypothetical protein